MAAKLRKGDKVIVLAGKDKSRQGTILEIRPKDNKAIVEGINGVIRHEKQTQNSTGGRVTKHAPIDLSNLALVDPKDGGATRVGFRVEDGKKVRFAKKSGAVINA